MKLTKTIIYITGIDGSGKTKLAEMLKNEFESKNKKVNYIWLRFNHYISKILLGYAKITKLSFKVHKDGTKIGYWKFYKNKFFSHAFVVFQIIDTCLSIIFKIFPKTRKKDSILIIDRFVYDILIDLTIACKLRGLKKGLYRSIFKKLIPQNTIIINLQRDKTDILKSRKENLYDDDFELRYQEYINLKDEKDIIFIKNDGSLKDLKEKALEAMKL